MTSLIKISEAASLGLHGMMVLSREPDKMRSAEELSRILRVSEAHLAKVFQRLVRVGLLKSVRGPKGGFLLNRPAGKISMLEIFEAIEGPLSPVHCMLGTPVCKDQKCIFGNVIEGVNEKIIKHMAETKLSSQTKKGLPK